MALELVDHRLAHPASDDYRFILSVSSPDGGGPEELCGYLCYGRTPMTRSTYDLHWIGTSPPYARSGVARGLLSRLEGEIAREGGGLVRAETGSREGHGGAVHFYDATGFTRTATIADFYAPGDDLIIFTKRVRLGPEADAFEGDEAALQDAAFGYRDYAAERDFLLECARRFGRGEVRRVLAWSSGSGRHLQAFAGAGIGGTGTDPSPAMIAYAQHLAGARLAGVDGASRSRSRVSTAPPAPRSAGVRFVRAALDERPVADPPIAPVDLSFVLLSSITSWSRPRPWSATSASRRAPLPGRGPRPLGRGPRRGGRPTPPISRPRASTTPSGPRCAATPPSTRASACTSTA